MQAITNGNDVPWNNLIAGNGSPLPISVNLQEKKKHFEKPCMHLRSQKGQWKKMGKRNSKPAESELRQELYAKQANPKKTTITQPWKNI